MPSSDILVIASTNRPGSLTRVVAKRYQTLLAAQGVTAPLLDLQDLPHDFTHSALYSNQGKDPQCNILIAQMQRQDKYVFVVPEYNKSFPGVLKAFIDGLPKPRRLLRGKKAALVGVSNGRLGAALAMSHLADILLGLGVYLLPQMPKLSAIPAPTLEALEARPDYLEALEQQAAALVAF